MNDCGKPISTQDRMGSNAEPFIYLTDRIYLFIARCFGEESGQSLESSARA